LNVSFGYWLIDLLLGIGNGTIKAMRKTPIRLTVLSLTALVVACWMVGILGKVVCVLCVLLGVVFYSFGAIKLMNNINKPWKKAVAGIIMMMIGVGLVYLVCSRTLGI